MLRENDLLQCGIQYCHETIPSLFYLTLRQVVLNMCNIKKSLMVVHLYYTGSKQDDEITYRKEYNYGSLQISLHSAYFCNWVS